MLAVHRTIPRTHAIDPRDAVSQKSWRLKAGEKATSMEDSAMGSRPGEGGGRGDLVEKTRSSAVDAQGRVCDRKSSNTNGGVDESGVEWRRA